MLVRALRLKNVYGITSERYGESFVVPYEVFNFISSSNLQDRLLFASAIERIRSYRWNRYFYGSKMVPMQRSNKYVLRNCMHMLEKTYHKTVAFWSQETRGILYTENSWKDLKGTRIYFWIFFVGESTEPEVGTGSIKEFKEATEGLELWVEKITK